jgi:uncharacterized membrane protein YfcA
MPSRLPVLIAIGLVAGVFSGLFGVGGGIVVVPMLVAFAAYPPKTAMATSLGAILFTAIAAAASHGQAGNVNVRDGLLIGIPATGGAVIGAALQQRIPQRELTLAFAVFLGLVALRLAA